MRTRQPERVRGARPTPYKSSSSSPLPGKKARGSSSPTRRRPQRNENLQKGYVKHRRACCPSRSRLMKINTQRLRINKRMCACACRDRALNFFGRRRCEMTSYTQPAEQPCGTAAGTGAGDALLLATGGPTPGPEGASRRVDERSPGEEAGRVVPGDGMSRGSVACSRKEVQGQVQVSWKARCGGEVRAGNTGKVCGTQT